MRSKHQSYTLKSALMASAAAAVMVAAVATPATAQDGAVPEYEGVDEMGEFHLTVTDYNSPTVPAGQALQAMADYVSEASDGKIEMEIFWSSSLMSASEHAEGIASGLADFGMVSPIYTPADFPIANWLTTLANQAYGGVPYGNISYGSGHFEFIMTNEELQQEFAERDLQILGGLTGPAFDLMCREPITTLADFQGQRARTAGQVFAREAEAVGMTPVPLVPTEMYEAFERGIVDGVILHPSGYQDFGLVDASGPKYFINTEFSGFNSVFYSINKGIWDSMPPVAQQIMLDGYLVSFENQLRASIARHKSFGEIIASGRIEAVQADPEVDAALKAFQAQQVEELAETAPDTVEDPQAMIDQYLAAVEKWKEIAINDLGFEAGDASDVEARMQTWTMEYDFDPYLERLREELAEPGI